MNDGKEYKAWMLKEGIKEVDVAHYTRLSVKTIHWFLIGKPVGEATKANLLHFYQSWPTLRARDRLVG
jgi:hypothetical protein